MSISIEWRVVRPNEGKRLPGTSTDWAVFQRIFGDRPLSDKDVEKLVAMHAATGYDESLWGALADVLNDLPEGTKIEVTGQY